MDKFTEQLDAAFTPAPGDNYVPRDVDDLVPASRGSKFSAGEAIKASFKTDTLTASLMTWMGGEETGVEAGFGVTEDMLKEAAADGVKPEHLSSLAGVGTQQAWDARKARILSDYDTDEEIRRMGGMGTAIRMGNAIADPASWAAAVASGGMSKVQSASRVGKIAKGAGQAARSEALIAGSLAAASPTYDFDDAMLATGTGFLLGGTLSAFGRVQHSGMRPDESKALDAAVSREVSRAASFTPSGSGGAARVLRKEKQNHSSMDVLYEAMKNDPAFSYDVKLFGKGTRFDMQGQLGQSLHPIVRGTSLAKDAAGKAEGRVNPYSASEWKTREVGVSDARYLTTVRPLKEEYKTQMGYKFLTPSKEREFNEAVGKAVRDRTQALSPVHAKAADAAAVEFKEILKKAQEAGVRGFDKIKSRDNYLPRLHNRDKFLRAERAYGTEGIEKFIAGALRSEVGDIAADKAAAVAKGYVATLRSLRVRDGAPLWNAQGGASREAALEVLKEELGDKVSEDVLSDVFDLMVPTPKDSGIARTKSRLSLDETYQADIQNANGGMERFRLDDLLENDVEGILATYRNTVLGQAALSKQGFASKTDFDRMLQQIRDTAEEVEGYTTTQRDNDIKRLEFLYNHVSGTPNFRTSDASRTWTERVLKYNFARVMNKTGFAQMSEIGLMVNHAGTGVLLDGVPELKQFMKRIKTGDKVDDEILDTIEQVWGFGTKTLRGQSLSRFVDVEGALERSGASKLDDALHVAGNVTAIGSGLGPLTDGMQLMTAKGAIVKWANSARSGSAFMSKERMAHLGVDEDMLKRINAELSSKGTYKGQRGQQLPRIDLNDWSDVEAKDFFIAAIDRHTRRIIQENDIGQLAGIMTHPIARIMLQFKGFSLGSYTNHLLYGANMKDAMAVREMFSTSFGGLLGYSAAVYAGSVGRPDQKEYLEKRLNSKAAAAAMVYRSSHAAFMPGMVDMAVQGFGFDPIFGHARNTGLDTATLMSNPTIDLANSAIKGVGGTARAIVDPNYDFSQQQMGDLSRSMVFQNALGIQNILNITKAELPERPQ